MSYTAAFQVPMLGFFCLVQKGVGYLSGTDFLADTSQTTNEFHIDSYLDLNGVPYSHDQSDLSVHILQFDQKTSADFG